MYDKYSYNDLAKFSYFCFKDFLSHLHIYLPGAETSLKSWVSQLVKKFPTFYGTQRFITMFTRAFHLCLS